MNAIRRILFVIGLLISTSDFTTAAEPRTPNMLFLIADDWGAHAGAYGTKWIDTPAFDRVAREGVLFRNAYTPTAKCAPSRASLVTGRYPWQLGAAANHLCYFPAEYKSWGETLVEQGWFVGNTGKVWGPGVANTAEGKSRSMHGRNFSARTLTPPTTGISKNDYAANFDDFLAEAPQDKPWAFWCGAQEPHRDYEFGSGAAKGMKRLDSIDRVPKCWPDVETVRHDMLDYALEVEHFDRHIGRMIERLERMGAAENTLVIITSDHGPPFPRGKGNTYPLSNQVPLAMRWPAGIKHVNRTIEDFVSLADLAPTILEALRSEKRLTSKEAESGRSLMPLLTSERGGRIDPARDHAIVGRERNDIGRPHDQGYPVRGIVTQDYVLLHNYEPSRWPAVNPIVGYLDCDTSPTKSLILAEHRKERTHVPWKLCFGKRGEWEFYNRTDDPDCVANLLEGPLPAEAIVSRSRELRESLEAHLLKQEDPRRLGRGAQFDEYPHSTKTNIGFYERFIRGEKLNAGWVAPSDREETDLED